MAEVSDADQYHGELRSVRCCSPMTSSSHGGNAIVVAAGPAMTDSFHGAATYSERSEDPSTESRMCTEDSVERMTSSTEGMISLSEDDSEDTHAEAHGVAAATSTTRRSARVRVAAWKSSAAGFEAACGGGASSSSAAAAAAAAALIDAAVAGHSSDGRLREDTVDADEQSDEQMMNGLLGSYREISLEDDDVGCRRDGQLKRGSSCSAEAGGDTEEEVSNLSPDSLLPSPQYVDEPIDEVASVDFEGDAEVEPIGLEPSVTPNPRPNNLQLKSFVGGGGGGGSGGARSKRPTSSSSSGNSPGRRSRYHHYHGHHQEESHKEQAGVPSSMRDILSVSAPMTMTSTTPAMLTAISSSSSASISSSSDLEGVYSGLQGLQGLILREGDMVSFVAEDLQEQIRRSSPITRCGDTPSFPGSRSSTPSLYKQAVTPQVVPIDPTVLVDVESQARIIAASVDTILENLTGTLHSMSSLTVDCMESYHESVCKTCDSMDGNIKAMYQLMAKIEELGNMMRPVHRLSSQIKDIKRLLDLLEHVATSSGS